METNNTTSPYGGDSLKNPDHQTISHDSLHFKPPLIKTDLGYIPLESSLGVNEVPTSASTEGQMSYEDWPDTAGPFDQFDDLILSPTNCGPSSSRKWKPVASLRRKMRKVSDGLVAKFKHRDVALQASNHKRKPSTSTPSAAQIKGKKTRSRETGDPATIAPLYPNDMHGFTSTSVYPGQETTAGPRYGDASTTAKKDFDSIYNCYANGNSNISTNGSLVNPNQAEKMQHDNSSSATVRTSTEFTSRANLLPKQKPADKLARIHPSDPTTAALIASFLKSQRQALRYHDRMHKAEVHNLEMKIELRLRTIQDTIVDQVAKAKDEANILAHAQLVAEQYHFPQHAGNSAWLPVRQAPPWGNTNNIPSSRACGGLDRSESTKVHVPQNSDDYAYTPQSPEITRQLEEALYQTTWNNL